MKLSKEERELLGSVERGEWKSVENLESEIARYRAAAAATTRKDKRVNIRMSERDLLQIQRKAAEEGLPYQTLIASVLHKYVNGQLAR